MNSLRLKQTLKYQLSYFGWSSLWVYGISVTVMAVVIALVAFSVTDSNISAGLGGVGFLHLFILGIGIRSDLKFFLQHGISRRTTFFNNLIGSFICAVMLGLFCEVFNLIFNRWIYISGYVDASGISGFFKGWIAYVCSFFFAWQVGALISLIYYRLGALQKVIFSVLGAGALVLGFSGAVRYIIGIADEFGDGMLQSLFEGSLDIVMPIALGVLILAMFSAVGNYFLLRRAPVKE